MSEKELITAEEILKAEDVRYAYVDVDEWGEGKVIRLKSLTAKEASAFQGTEGLVGMLIKSAVDENDVPLFTEGFVERLKEKSFSVFTRIQNAAMVLNGMEGLDKTQMKIKNG